MEAEGEGFEPSIRLTTDNGFRVREARILTLPAPVVAYRKVHVWAEPVSGKGSAALHDWYRENRDRWEPIKRSDGFREFYDRQYAARLSAG